MNAYTIALSRALEARAAALAAAEVLVGPEGRMEARRARTDLERAARLAGEAAGALELYVTQPELAQARELATRRITA